MTILKFIGASLLASMVAIGAIPPKLQEYDNSSCLHALLQNVLNMEPLVTAIAADKTENAFLTPFRALAKGMKEDPTVLCDTKALHVAIRLQSKGTLTEKGPDDAAVAFVAMQADPFFGPQVKTKFAGPLYKTSCTGEFKDDIFSWKCVDDGDAWPIPLPVPMARGQGVEALLDELFEGKIVEGKGVQLFLRVSEKGLLVPLPEFLVFQLKRFILHPETNKPFKINREFTTIPMTLQVNRTWLRGSDTVAIPDNFDLVYNLIGVIAHVGDDIAKGYTAYIKDQHHSGRAWYRYDDVGSVVTPIVFDATKKEAVAAQFKDGYIFFYRKASAEQKSINDQKIAEEAERVRLEKERVEKVEKERLEKEKAEKERIEREKLTVEEREARDKLDRALRAFSGSMQELAHPTEVKK